MTEHDFIAVCQECVAEIKARAPIDTGNLRYNAIQYEYLGDFKFAIYVNEDIAPYVYYTNEPWVADRWQGAKNPNEAWWQNAVRSCIELIKTRLKGVVK